MNRKVPRLAEAGKRGWKAVRGSALPPPREPAVTHTLAREPQDGPRKHRPGATRRLQEQQHPNREPPRKRVGGCLLETRLQAPGQNPQPPQTPPPPQDEQGSSAGKAGLGPKEGASAQQVGAPKRFSGPRTGALSHPLRQPDLSKWLARRGRAGLRSRRLQQIREKSAGRRASPFFGGTLDTHWASQETQNYVSPLSRTPSIATDRNSQALQNINNIDKNK